ncbi:calcium-transporting P-type ATPase, PMR1-type [bacterium]|nr:calcium-transporting P-type ATPase, PMR1-type [bacterium]
MSPPTMGKDFYQISVQETIEQLQTDGLAGLSEGEAEKRLQIYGPNELKETRRRHPLLMFLSQFADFLIIVLIAAAIISLLTGEITDFAVIIAVLILNALMGFIQEYRAEKAIQALKKMATPFARVIREGKVREIPSNQLVPGDIVLLESGMVVPADCRLIEAINLQVNEAPISGESLPVDKNTAPIEEDAPLAERSNMVFSGTIITAGHGKAVVVNTGMRTEMGKITQFVEGSEEKKTPLQERMEQLGKWLGISALMICALILVVGVFQKRDMKEMFLTAVSLAVAAIPEGLPAVITISLALGARRMAKRNALIRKLSAVETLGCVTHICSDKTGTLTQNKMFAEVVYTNGKLYKVTGRGYEPKGDFYLNDKRIDPLSEPNLKLLLEAGALCNDAHLVREGDEWKIIGDPTEGALLVLAAKANISKQELESSYPRVAEVPFDSQRKRMSTIHRTQTGYIVFTKGALEGLLLLSNKIYENGIIRNLEKIEKEEILKLSEEYAIRGMRILGLCFKQLAEEELREISSEALEKELVFLGFVGIVDPARPEAQEAIKICREAGIQPIMITGDQPATASAIAKDVGLVETETEVMTGRELDKMSDEELFEHLQRTKVYARVSPEQKLRIVRLLRKFGYITATTGDGVNDAPALKEADIGVSMGITGTDVAKETSDMVLLDDNFATIVAAVEEGRVIYDNIRKFIRYILTTNLGEILTIFFSIIFKLPLPLRPVQILWINLLTDGLPAIALGVEPPEPGVMKRPPRDPKESIFAGGMVRHILLGGLWMAICTLLLFHYYQYSVNIDTARTMAFTTLSLFQMANVLAIRSERYSVLSIGFFSNPLLILAVISTLILQLCAIYIPLFQRFFHTVALSPLQLLISSAVASTIFFLIELDKYLSRKVWGKPI